MKKISLILSLCFLTLTTAHTSDTTFSIGDWEHHPCLVMLNKELKNDPDITFTFRNGISLRATAQDPESASEKYKDFGIAWSFTCIDVFNQETKENMTSVNWSEDFRVNIKGSIKKGFGISLADVRTFYLAEEYVKNNDDMWPLWQIFFAKPQKKSLVQRFKGRFS